MQLTKSKLLEELKKLEGTGTFETRKIKADSLLLTYIFDPEIDEAYMKYAYKN